MTKVWVVVAIAAAACGGDDGGEGATCPGPTTVFVNFDGGTYTRGAPSSSLTNQSNFLRGASFTFAASAIGADERAAIIACVEEKFAAFNIAFTLEEPSVGDHREIVMVTQQEMTDATGLATVSLSPTCTSSEQAYSTEDIYGNAVMLVVPGDAPRVTPDSCWTIAQSIAYTFELGRAARCDDLTSFSAECSVESKGFVDEELACGVGEMEFPCSCTPGPQNSYQRLLAMLGPACE